MTPDKHVIKSGHLPVGNGHKIYWEEWGNPQAPRILHLHGGPGATFEDGHKALYDPSKHHVIFHDQRGAGRSTPFASTEHNTTQHLIADIEKLRLHTGVKEWYVAGGSWGSALSLLYAIAHPKRVRALILWSIYLCRQSENDWVNEGYPRYHFPAEWERFIALVPEEHRGSGNRIMQYYVDKMQSGDAATAQRYVLEWALWECTLLSMNYDPATLEQEVREDMNLKAVSLLETHYFLHGCFVPENFILDNLHKIQHIPSYAVHGRFDMCTPAASAHQLAKSYGKNFQLQWVNSGHKRTDPEMLAALRAIMATRIL